MAAHQLPDVTVVADAGMISEANQKQIETAGLSCILGMRIADVPYVAGRWRGRYSNSRDGPTRHKREVGMVSLAPSRADNDSLVATVAAVDQRAETPAVRELGELRAS